MPRKRIIVYENQLVFGYIVNNDSIGHDCEYSRNHDGIDDINKERAHQGHEKEGRMRSCPYQKLNPKAKFD